MAVSRELHDYVVKRDGGCFWAKLDDDHECRDQWGTPHSPRLLSKLTVDHFWLHAGGTKGKRAPDRREHMVAMCWKGNVTDSPPKRVREAERAYSRALYPDYEEVAA